MDLKTNICDSIKECEIKLGYQEETIHLYYPENTLLELLEATPENLHQKTDSFCKLQAGLFGKITIEETQEKGRYCISIPAKGVKYVHENIAANPFMEAFVQEIHKPGLKKDDILKLFYQFSKDVIEEKIEDNEWAIYFQDDTIDAYVYYIEEDGFGLQYHRFTKETFSAMQPHHTNNP